MMQQFSNAEVSRAIDAGLKVLNHDDIMCPMSLKGPLNVLHSILVGLSAGELRIMPTEPPAPAKEPLK